MRNEFFLLHIKTGVLIMSYDYSENILVQESAGNLLRDELGGEQKFAHNYNIFGDLLLTLISSEIEE